MPKNTAKKCAAGGIAKRVSGPLGLPATSPVPASPGVEGEVEVAWLDVHSQWCLICCDGAEGDVVLYECSGCPQVMCSRCLEVLSDSHDITSHPDILFWSLSCHTEHTKKVPVPYHGFYSVLATVPIAVIHFILGGSKEIVTPVPFLSHYLSHYFPNGSYIYLKVPFDVAMHRIIHSYTCTQEARVTQLKSHLTRSGCIFAFFSDHSEEDSGWLFAGKEKGSFVTMSVSQVLSTVLGPYSGILRGAMMVFLVCGSVVAHDDSFGELQQTILDYNVASAIIFSATQFQPLIAMNFLLVLAEQVIVEQLDISKVFPGLLTLSSRLGDTPSWSMKVAVRAAHESQEPDVQDQAPVSRYLYACAYPECGKVQNKSSYKFYIDKLPGFLVNAAKTKSSNWFQSPSTTFPPSLMSLPASCGPSDTKGKCPRSRDGEVLTKRICI
ncbi:hypothetical protein EDB19DRAFT_1833389 [Suillus lakei]|nr:hypothetical protein EDB19DRAFT_1833389 [Suillus lakei]